MSKMPRKPPPVAAPSLDDQVDTLLGNLLSSGWDDEVGQAVAEVAAPAPAPKPAKPAPVVKSPQPDYPPLPVRDGMYEMPMVGQKDPSEPGMLVNASGAADEAPPRFGPPMDIGLLTDLATGRPGAFAAAEAAGFTQEDLQSSLALALRDTPPAEIAKALGLQAAEQQLKSGALYGAVLAALVNDMATGRMRAETKIELAKMLAKVGRLEPKEEKLAAGGGFTLNISMGSSPQPIIIDHD